MALGFLENSIRDQRMPVPGNHPQLIIKSLSTHYHSLSKGHPWALPQYGQGHLEGFNQSTSVFFIYLVTSMTVYRGVLCGITRGVCHQMGSSIFIKVGGRGGGS